MVFVPEGSFQFRNSGGEIEGKDAWGVDTQYPWEAHPQKEHSHKMDVGPFYIDKYPITIANYATYLKASGFRPVDPYNWLKNWKGSTTPPRGLEELPVTYVSLSEARAYCAWAHGGS